MSIFAKLNNRKFKYGAVATSVTIVVIAVIVVLNIIISILADRFDLTYDMTPNKLYDISDESIDFVKEIKDDIVITALLKEQEMQNSGEILKQTNKMIEKIKNANSKIKVEYVDVEEKPALAQKYSEDGLAGGGILIENKTRENRYKYIPYASLFSTSYDQYTGQESLQSINSEREITSALLVVTSAKTPKVEVVSGHGEKASTALQDVLTKNNYTFSDINLIEKDIAADTDFLLIYAPSNDFSDEELKKLDAFMSNDGKLGKNIFLCYSITEKPLTKLDTFLKEWGISPENFGYYETDESNMMSTQISQYPLSRFFVQGEDMSTGFKTDVYSLYLQSRYIKQLWENSGDKKTEIIVNTGEKNMLVPLDNPEWEPADDTEVGQYPIIVRSAQQKYDSDNNPLVSTIYVSGSYDVFEIIPLLSVNNGKLLLNMFNAQTGAESPLMIEDKTTQVPSMTIDAGVVNVLGIVFMAIVPIGLVVVGIVIWVRRKRL